MSDFAIKLRTPTGLAVPIAGNIDFDLRTFGFDARLLLVFSGSNVGTVTVTGRLPKGDKMEAITNGVLNLANVKYLYVPDIPLEYINMACSGGSGSLTVNVFQLPNR